jgi:hypothetical protein
MNKKLTVVSLNEMLSTDLGLIFTFTPTTLRAMCADAEVAEEFAGILQSMCGRRTRGFADSPLVYDNVHVKPRAGFSIDLTDHEWLKRMGAIAFSCYAYGPAHPAHVDANEIGVGLEGRTNSADAVHAAHATGIASDDKGTEPGAAPTPTEANRAYFLAPLREGHFEVPNLITGTEICATGSRTKARKSWGNAKPLKINRVLGQSRGAYEIVYTGEQLRPGDIETFTQVLKQAAGKALGSSLTVTSRSLLQNIPGRGTGSNSYTTIKEELFRLQEAKLQIKSTCPLFIANLFSLFPEDEIIESAVETGCVHISTHLLSTIKSDGGKTFSIEISPTVLALFGTKLTSWFNETKYYSLRGITARRLYLLYGSQTNCWPLTQADMREFLGSGMEDDDKFRKSLAKAHDELKTKGVIRAWRYEVPQSGRRINEHCYVVAHKEKAFSKEPAKTAEA